MEADQWFNTTIQRDINGIMCRGRVEYIQQGKSTGQRLYLVRYEDGDLEHLDVAQMRAYHDTGAAPPQLVRTTGTLQA